LIAAAEQADLIVVGSRHGRAGGALRLAVGDYVAMHHRGPVLVVRVPAWPPGADYGARPIVVGVEHVPASTPVLPFALTEARLRGCEVIAMHIAGGDLASADRVEDRNGVQVHHRVVAGDPASALIATSGTAAALVVGRHGHEGSGLGGPRGSVSRSLLQHAHCPVFLVG
jgi:nucleotide-binding universal stress UspA family protein